MIHAYGNKNKKQLTLQKSVIKRKNLPLTSLWPPSATFHG